MELLTEDEALNATLKGNIQLAGGLGLEVITGVGLFDAATILVIVSDESQPFASVTINVTLN